MELFYSHIKQFKFPFWGMFHVLFMGIGIVGFAQTSQIAVEPEIEFISCFPESVKAFSDSLTLTLAYIDGDGDLGENSPAVRNLFLVDSRNGLEYAFRLQKLWDKKEKAVIKGKIKVVVEAPYLMDETADSEEVKYIIYVKDRAGNESNRVETGTVKISR